MIFKTKQETLLANFDRTPLLIHPNINEKQQRQDQCYVVNIPGLFKAIHIIFNFIATFHVIRFTLYTQVFTSLTFAALMRKIYIHRTDRHLGCFNNYMKLL